MVLHMCDTPGVVRDTKPVHSIYVNRNVVNYVKGAEGLRGMKSLADGVVDELGFRQGLMPALVSDAPEPSADKPNSEAVQFP